MAPTVQVELPALGESVVEGTVSRWLVKEGEPVRRDQPLVEVTTDKVDAEIPAPDDGVVERILVAEGETVAIGTALATIAVGAAAKAAPATKAAAPAKGKAAAKAAAPVAKAAAPAEPPLAERPRATPVARRAAGAEGLDLAGIEGTGPGGRITRADVQRRAPPAPAPATPPSARLEAASAPAPGSPAPVHRLAPAPGGPTPPYLTYQVQPGDRLVPMTPLRRIVAEHMVLSKQIAPHVGTVAEVDMAAVVRLREAHKRGFRDQHGFPLTFLPFVVHAAVRALRMHPRLNASVLEDAIVEKQAIHVGVAVETDKGLVVPVVRDADRLSLVGLAQAIEDISERARSKRLSPDDLRGGTFTVSNPGRHGNLYGFAIINQPQVGILRMGEIVKRLVVREVEGEDAIVIRPIMHLALSYDHRAVDGAPANGFLHAVREVLEAGEFEL
jgi:2-oxoglutarate dehydrogenase E2 component (dihydrolipoamide succinyltransferase)